MSEQIIIFSQIVFIDLVLAGDNEIIIGMVVSNFPLEQGKRIIFQPMMIDMLQLKGLSLLEK